MNKKLFFCVLFFSFSSLLKAQQNVIPVVSFNNNWEFVKDIIDTTDAGKKLSLNTGKSLTWEKISLPHTPRLEPVKKVTEQWQGTCFYRKYFTVSPAQKGKHIALRFDAAMHDADVYLNGKHIYKHLGGYLPFTVDLDAQLYFNRPNCILVKLNNQDNADIPPGKPIKDLDFNYYGGIYRNIWLIVTNRIYISDAVQENTEARGGLLVHTDSINSAQAILSVKADLRNGLDFIQKAFVKLNLKNAAGETVATTTSPEQVIKPGELCTIKQRLIVQAPRLWSVQAPNLYNLEVQVLQNSMVVDEQVIKTGIRTLKLEPDGFLLNGQKVKLRGTNRHQEYPWLGYALSDQMQFRDAWKIKEAGFNFVRCSHYPPAPAFLDACDELGILVMDAIPGWQFFGKEAFQKNSLQNVRDMIRRDRNHPSIILWEASLNETNMSKPYMDTANAIAHRELPFTDTYSTGWVNYAYDVFNPARQHAQAPNYWKKYNATRPLLIAEYGDWEYYAQNAGFNQKAYECLKKEERNSRQLRTDGQARLLQQALNYQEAHNDNLGGKSIGDANWLMFDYKRGYADDVESSGIMDINRLPKFSYYFYQSQNGPVPDTKGFGKPMIYIANYWNDARQKNVKIFSNCDEVQLYLNNRLIGRNRPDTDAVSTRLTHPPFTFRMDGFVSGMLKAIGYVKGEKVVSSVKHTPGKACKILIKIDESGKRWKSGVNDVILVYAHVVDTYGNDVPEASNQIKFYATGDSKVIGNKVVNAEAGIATCLIKAGNKRGNIIIKATSRNLRLASINYLLQ